MDLFDNEGKKVIYLIVGKSACGKSHTVSNLVKDSVFKDLPAEYNPFKEVKSATTRDPRYDGEQGHRFVDIETYQKEKDDMLAYTLFNGNHYYTTPDDLKGALFYIIDPKGVDFFKSSKHIEEYHPIVVWVKCDPIKRIYRLIKRDGLIKGIKRWISDFKEFKNWKRINPDIIAPSDIADSVIEINIFGKNFCSIAKVLNKIPNKDHDECEKLINDSISERIDNI